MGPAILALPHGPSLSTGKRGLARDIGREMPLPASPGKAEIRWLFDNSEFWHRENICISILWKELDVHLTWQEEEVCHGERLYILRA